MAALLKSPQLRVPIALVALAAAAAGQWWLSIELEPRMSAYMWIVAAALFIFLLLDPAARALPPREEPLEGAYEWPAFAIVMLVGVVFRTYGFDILPAGLNHDTAFNGLYAIRILSGEPYTPYTAEASGRETLMFYLQALSIKVFGPDVFALILPASLGAILLLPVFYLWVRQLFGPRLALGATFLLAVSGWHVVFSRVGWRAVLQPLVSTVAYLFFARGLASNSLLNFSLAGASAAAALYTYNAARALPALFVGYALLRTAMASDRRALIRRYWSGAIAMAVAFVVAIAPMAYYAVQHWDVWQERAAETYFWSDSNLWINIRETLLLYSLYGNGEDFFTTTPLLEYPAAVLLGFGMLWCLFRFFDYRALFLLLGFLVSVSPGLVSRPNGNRDIGSLPFIFVFVGLGGAFFVRELLRLRTAGRMVTAFAVAAVALAASYATYAQYFGSERRLPFGFYPETTNLARYMKDLVPKYEIWVGGANFPLNTLLYLSYQGSGDPMRANFTWVDDITELPAMKFAPPAGKGLAFIIAAHAGGPVVFDEMAQRYPAHRTAELRDPSKNNRIFARALLVAPDVAAEEARRLEDGQQLVTRGELWAGHGGTGPGELEDPKGVAVGPHGEFYIADTGNNRVQKFGADGKLLAVWGEQGAEVGQFREPNALAVDGAGNVHVVDTWNNRVQKFSPEGEVLTTYAPPEGFFGPRGIAIAVDRAYVTDGGHGTVAVFTVDGVFQSEFGGVGTAPGQTMLPIGIAVGRDGTVWVIDSGNNRLQAFNPRGESVRIVPLPWWAGDEIKEAYMATAPNGAMALTDPIGGDVYEIKNDGSLESIGFGFQNPTGIAAGARQWYVTQRHPPRVIMMKQSASDAGGQT